jgi:hypothetical protein
MTLSLNLSASVEAILKQRAAQAGQPVDAYVEQLVQNAVAPGTSTVLLAALAAAPPVPAEWVDELEQLIAQGQAPAVHDDPFASGAKTCLGAVLVTKDQGFRNVPGFVIEDWST